MEWKEENGLVFSELKTGFNASGQVLAVIYSPNRDNPKFVLGINGYRFEHDSLEKAKSDALDRVERNAGIYLSHHLP